LDFGLWDWWLITNVSLVNVLALGQGDLEHGDNSGEFKVVKTLNKWLELINDGDVGDLVDLVESLDSVLNKLGKVDSRLDGV